MDIKKSQTELHKFEISSERAVGLVVDSLASVNPFIIHIHWLWQEVDCCLREGIKIDAYIESGQTQRYGFPWPKGMEFDLEIFKADCALDLGCVLAFIHFHLEKGWSKFKKGLTAVQCAYLARFFMVTKRAGELCVQSLNVFLSRFWLPLRLPATHLGLVAQIWNMKIQQSHSQFRCIQTKRLNKFYFCMPAIFLAVVANPPNRAATSPGTCANNHLERL